MTNKEKLEKIEAAIMKGMELKIGIYKGKRGGRVENEGYAIAINAKKYLGINKGWRIYLSGNLFFKIKKDEYDIPNTMKDYMELFVAFEPRIKELNKEIYDYFNQLKNWQFCEAKDGKDRIEATLEHNMKLLKNWEYNGKIIKNII